MAVYFDFASMGVATTGELLKRLQKNVTDVFHFDHATQSMFSTSLKPDGGIIGDYTIRQGEVLNLMAATPTLFLQYAKLPKPYVFELKGENMELSNFNYCFLQPSEIRLHTAGDIFSKLGTGPLYLRRWSFSEQLWVSSRKIGTVVLNNFTVRPLEVLYIDMIRGAETVIW